MHLQLQLSKYQMASHAASFWFLHIIMMSQNESVFVKVTLPSAI